MGLNMPRWFPMGAVLLTITMAAGTFAEEYVLLQSGQSAARIVLARDAGPVEKHAAAELVAYLRKMSGATVEIQTAPSERLYNIFIGTVGSQNILMSGPIRATLSKVAPQGFLFCADDQGLHIIGRNPIGALYGVYHLLKKYADVRWFAPGPDYEHCPKKLTLAVPEQLTVSNPSFRYRYLGFVCSNWNSKTIDTWDWMVRNGMTVRAGKRVYKMYRDELEKRGAETYAGGHSFYYLMNDDLFDEHPEYYARRDGKRVKQVAIRKRGARVQPCTSNPAVAGIMAASLSTYLDLPPRGGSYLIGNNDSTRWCECENCTRLDPPAERRKGLVSTRYYTFVNQVAGEVYKRHPEAELWSWAYQNFQPPPTGVVPDKRLAISVCVHHRCYRHSMADKSCLANAKFREMLSGWMKFGNPVVTREYDESLGGQPPYLPVEHIYCQDIRYYHKLGLSGFIMIVPPPDGTFGTRFNRRGIKEAWFALWQMKYLGAQLAWDVATDYASLVEDMGSKYYGPAWPVMKLYRQELVKMYEETPGHICYGTPEYILGKCLDKPGVEARLLGLLDEAEALAVNDGAALRRVNRDREYFGLCWQTVHKKFLSMRQSELRVKRRIGRIVIDGKLGEPGWKKTDFITGFVATDHKTGADPQTFVRVLYDGEGLYFAVEAMLPRSSRMRVNTRKRDAPVWSDSSIEFFIVAPGMGGKYAQVVVNPRGVVYDALNTPSQQADLSFDSAAEVGTAVLTDRWIAEVRLPTAPLGRRAKDGEAWKINVCRNYSPAVGKRQSSSWSHGVFHGSEAYRSAVFGTTALLENGDFEDGVEPNKYQKKTAWVFINNRIPVHWSFHGGRPGTAALVRDDAASGRQFLRVTGGWIHQKVHQAADYRNNLAVRCKVRGRGRLNIAVYRYTRSTDKHVSTVWLKRLRVDSREWSVVDAMYECRDDKVLRLAFHMDGEIDIDDVAVMRELAARKEPVQEGK